MVYVVNAYKGGFNFWRLIELKIYYFSDLEVVVC